MPDAKARGWGDPGAEGSATAKKYAKDHITSVSAGGVKLNVRREVAPLFKGFCDELVASGYPLTAIADDWGYNNRDIRGRPGVKSNHSWGLAIDINSTTNPMTEDGRSHTDMPIERTRKLAARWGLSWGADYSGSRRDPMHFEFLGKPADVTRFPIGAPASTTTSNTDDQEVDDMFYVIGSDGVPALYAYHPACGAKGVKIPFSSEADYKEAIAGRGFGGHQKFNRELLEAIPMVTTGEPGL